MRSMMWTTHFKERSMSPTIIIEPEHEVPIEQEPPPAAPPPPLPVLEPDPDPRRDWLFVAVGLTALLAIMGIVIGVASLAGSGSQATTVAAPARHAAVPVAAADRPAPTPAPSEGLALQKVSQGQPNPPGP